MIENEFTSGPLRDFSAQELGSPHFTDLELLSDSGHNCVYRAMTDGKWVILKTAKEEEGNTTRNLLLLQREYDIMHAIDCLYVVKTWQLTDVPSIGKAIVMEYIQGRPLDRFVAENPSMAERRRVADELMEALIFLHERQVVHGDLKPSNILVTNSGNHVRLIDFGFSDNEAYIAKNIGSTPSVTSPEQLPTDVLKPERDIYALGKMLALLFPHSSIHQSIISSIVRRYTSVRQVRSALHRYWRMQWLVPLILAITTIVAFVIVFLPNPTEMAQTPETQTDTVVVVIQPTQPEVDSVWLKLKVKTDKQYTSLYLTYADSLTNMPVKSMNEGSAMTNRYAAQMHQTRDKLAKSYPQYEEQLQKQCLVTYGRDLPRLQIIYKDYPMMHVNLNADTTFILQKPLSE